MAKMRMEDAQGLWMRMYMGDAPWLAEDGLVSMNLPAFVAGEVARLATVEMESRVRGKSGGRGARAEYLDGEYQRVVRDARVFTEYAAAGGSLILKPYVDGGRILVDYVKAGAFVPVTYDATGQITGCLFTERATVGGVEYTRVESHQLEKEGLRIQNRAYRADAVRGGAARGRGWWRMGKGDGGMSEWGAEVALSSVPQWTDLAADALLQGVDRPLFAHLRMPYANSVDPQSPLGVSAFAKAADLMREADRQFSRLIWEMESGERALYVDMRAFDAEDTQPGRLPFKRFYRTMDIDPQADTLFAEWSPAYREKNQIAALNEILQRVEDLCGLSRGTLSEAPESASRGARTATELKIMRQRTYATVRDAQKAVECALRDLLYAMDAWADLAGLCPAGEWTVSFTFDDSVVTDRGEEFAERMKLVEAGAMAPWELRMWYLGETEEVARGASDLPLA